MAVEFNSVRGTQGAQAPNRDAYQDLDLDVFLKLLIAELQHQDPMEPMKNSEILQQVSQIRAIESNTRLTSTLESVTLGQNLSTASNLLGKTVRATVPTEKEDETVDISGKVERVTIEDGKPRIHLGEKILRLDQITEIVPEATEPATEPANAE